MVLACENNSRSSNSAMPVPSLSLVVAAAADISER
jgi:hypothetical protein